MTGTSWDTGPDGRPRPARGARWTRALLRVGLGAALILGLVLVLQTFVVGLYRVDSASMEPTIHGASERVVVDYLSDYSGAARPERFDLVVLLRRGRAEAEVKRVVGLPSESIAILDGDLLVDGARLPDDVPRPPPVELFVQDEHEFASAFTEPELPFGQDAEGWHLDARGTAAEDSLAGGFAWRHPLNDDYLGLDRRRVAGSRAVGDAIVECELRLGEGDEEASGRALWRLTERGDVFELEIEITHPGPSGPGGPGSAGGARARLLRRDGQGLSEVLDEAAVAAPAGTWHRWRFFNRDNHLRVDLDGVPGVLAHTYAANRPPATEQQHLLPRIAFEARGLTATLRGVRILRDLHYTQAGVHATHGPLELGPDEIFVLGDNSAESLDGREWGPVGLGDVIGHPRWVVWPPGALRRLRPTEPAGGADAGAR